MGIPQLTTVKLDSDIFDEFKTICIKSKMNWQKLAERSMYLYNTDEEFRTLIHNTFPNLVGKDK
jgi:hypothetical protein